MFCNTEFRRKQTFNLSHYSIYVILSLNLLTKSKTKANSHDDIMPFFSKISANVIAHPLSAILNQCIAFGYFPNKLKIAKVIPNDTKQDQLTNLGIIDPFLFYLLCQKFLNA